MFYPIWWYYLLVSSGVERTKYFSLFSFISTSVLVSLLLNGNITPVLIYWKNLLDMEKVSTATTSLYVVLQQSDMPFILLFIRIEKQFVCELFCEIVIFIIIFLTENTYKVVSSSSQRNLLFLLISIIHALSFFIFCISAVHVKLQFPIFIQKSYV